MSFNDRIVRGGTNISNLFADYFGSVYDPSLPLNTAVVDDGASVGGVGLSSLLLRESDVLCALRSIDDSKGAGPDGLPPLLLKRCAEALTVPLLIIFNKSLTTGVFPAAWKTAYIIPIFKSGDKTSVRNYRPISILSQFGKIFEKLVYNVLFFNLKNQITIHQHGFFVGRSVETNLLEYTDFVLESKDRGMQVDAVYTDFCKAFDKVNHSLLIAKLGRVGISGDLLRWVESYVSNRTQQVKIAGYISDTISVTSGVPRGSHLGPLLFLLYINDIVQCFQYARCLLYADDMKVFLPVQSSADCHNLQNDLKNFSAFCKDNHSAVNYEKCHVISFSRSKSIILHSYNIDNNLIGRVSIIKDLGVMLDGRMAFAEHVDLIARRAFLMLGFVLRTARGFGDPQSYIRLYYAYVASHLSYCSSVWSPQYAIYVDRIEGVQRRFLRHLKYKFGYQDEHYTALCRRFGLLRLEDRRLCNGITFVQKLFCGQYDSPMLLERFQLNACARHLRLRELFRTPTVRTNFMRNSPLIRLSASCNNANTVDIFSQSVGSVKAALHRLCGF